MGTLLGLALSKEALVSSHVFTFGALVTVMTNVGQHFLRNAPPRRNGLPAMLPFMILVLASLLLLLSPLKNLVVNVCLSAFKVGGDDAIIEEVLNIAYKPVFGNWPMQSCTYLGYASMMIATALQVDICGKFVEACNLSKKCP